MALQWGRVLKDAEIQKAKLCPPSAWPASMGPRLEGRGNRPLWQVAQPSMLLQWGRVLKDAEMTGTSELSAASLLLQWGRVLKDAEIRRGHLAPWRRVMSFNGAAS